LDSLFCESPWPSLVSGTIKGRFEQDTPASLPLPAAYQPPLPPSGKAVRPFPPIKPLGAQLRLPQWPKNAWSLQSRPGTLVFIRFLQPVRQLSPWSLSITEPVQKDDFFPALPHSHVFPSVLRPERSTSRSRTPVPLSDSSRPSPLVPIFFERKNF